MLELNKLIRLNFESILNKSLINENLSFDYFSNLIYNNFITDIELSESSMSSELYYYIINNAINDLKNHKKVLEKFRHCLLYNLLYNPNKLKLFLKG